MYFIDDLLRALQDNHNSEPGKWACQKVFNRKNGKRIRFQSRQRYGYTIYSSYEPKQCTAKNEQQLFNAMN